VLSGVAPAAQIEDIVRHFLSCQACLETLTRLNIADSVVQRLQAAREGGSSADQERISSLILALGESFSRVGPLSVVLDDTLDARAIRAKESWRVLLRPPRGPDELGWLGDYRVLRLLGQGGMGAVLEAEDLYLKRRVALKIMHKHLMESPAARERFLREAQSAAAVKDDHIVTVYQVGQVHDVPFLAMEFLTGETLEARLERKGRLPLPEVLRIARETALGLGTAHEQGLIHRDIKPANIWLESRPGARDSQAPGGRVKVLDFGVARPIQADLRLTGQGQIVGTPHYMAPEQARGEPVDARADLFSLGCVLYEMTTGTRAFSGESMMAVLTALAVSTPRPVAELCPEAPPALAALTESMLSRGPAQRPASAWQVVDVLQAIEQDQKALTPATGVRPAAVATPSGARKSRRLAVLSAGAVVLVGLLGLTWWLKPWAGKQPGQDSAAADGPASELVAPAGAPIKVGVLHSLTGTMATSEKPVVDATLLAIEEINEQGGVLGRPIEAVVEDGMSDWPTFAKKAQKLITQDQVSAVFGCWTSASRKTVKPIFEKHDHLLFYPVQYEGLEQSPNIVYTGAAPNQQIIPAITWCCSFLRKKRLFLVGSDYVFPRAANAIIRDQARSLGATIVGEEYLLLGSTEAQPIVKKIAASKPDVIINTINGDSNLVFFRALRKAGIVPAQVPTISFSIAEEELSSLRRREIAGDYAAWNYFQSIDSRQNQAFVSRFHKKYGPGHVTTDPMEAAYIAVHLWAQAAQEAGSVEPGAVRGTIGKQSYDAPQGKVWVDPATQHLHKFIRIGQITDEGRFRVVYCSDETIPPVPYPATRTKAQWDAFLQDLHLRWGGQWANPGS
jgi:urea transport system substrate-binding protein